MTGILSPSFSPCARRWLPRSVPEIVAGVATAIALGGPGAVFWMWLSAFLGMMTNYAENTLGIKYRYRNEKGDWIGGAMIYIERGTALQMAGGYFLCLLFSGFFRDRQHDAGKFHCERT